MYLTDYGGVNSTIMIDKKIKKGYQHPKIHRVQYRFDPILYQNGGTVFEGELINTNHDQWVFLLTNIRVYKGKSISNMTIIKKIQLINRILTTSYQRDLVVEPCALFIKQYFPYTRFRYFIHEFIPALPYPCKGIEFHSLNSKITPILYLFQNRMDILKANQIARNEYQQEHPKENSYQSKKKKEDISKTPEKDKSLAENSTEEKVQQKIHAYFELQETIQPDVFELYLREPDDTYSLYSYAHIPSLKCSKMVNKLLKESSSNKVLVECQYFPDFQKWKPLSAAPSGAKPSQKKNVEAAIK